MRLRLVWVLTVVLVLAGVFAGVAYALDFEAEEEPGFTGTVFAPVAEVGQDYYYEIGTAGRCPPHDVAIDTRSSPPDALPPGLTMRRVDNEDFALEGVPTRAGTYRVWLIARDQCGTQPAELEFVFNVRERTWSISTQSLPAAAAGSPYSFQLQAAGGTVTATTWALVGGSLPAGLTLAPNGVISGTPSAPGSATFAVRATGTAPHEGNRNDTRTFTLNVTERLSATLTGGTLVEVGIPVRASLVAAGGQGPYTWAATSLPPGLTLSREGMLTGVPTRAGTYTVEARLTDANGTTLNVQERLVIRPRLAIATRRLAAAVAGRAYRGRVAIRGGAGVVRWSIARGRLPRGLRLSTRTGRITGRPTRSGTYRVTFRVRDALGATATKRLALRVR
jgi:Putative Ig domain